MSTDSAEATELRHPAQPFRLAYAELNGESRTVIAVGDVSYDLDSLLPPGEVAAPLPGILVDWATWQPVVAAAAARITDAASTVTPDRWLIPVNPSKLICIGTNYYDHLKEMGTPAAPALPYSFLKPVSTGLAPSGGRVMLPLVSSMVDWEAELAVVIGHAPIPGADIMECIAGYTVLNDLSARDWIRSKPEVGIDWVMMKAYDGFSPIGPFFTPAEFVTDPQDLSIKLWVNGELKQDSNTSQMVFSVRAILEHLVGIMTLEPGDVIATGTPSGVGFGQRPQQFLKHDDWVSIEIAGLGRLETHMVDPREGVHA